jgi:hypothetical protein
MDNTFIRAHKIEKDEKYQISTYIFSNPERVAVNKYIKIGKNGTLQFVDEKENIIGIVEQHILIKYKFKDVWDTFIKFLFKKIKINDVIVRVIKKIR